MSKNRPIIVGMNNPHSDDPRADLMPHPAGSAGHRLWRMLCDERPTTRAEYCRRFRRINLLRSRRWNLAEARLNLKVVMSAIPEGSEVILLGKDVQRVFRVRTEPMAKTKSRGVLFHSVPHPSGRNLFYNIEKNKRTVGRLMSRLAR